MAMRKIQMKDVGLFVAQVLLLSLVLMSPGLISFITSNDAAVVWGSLRIAAYWLAPALLVYLLNFYVCVPLLWFRGRHWWFGIANVLLITVCNFHLLFASTSSMPDDYRAGYSSFQMIAVLVNLMVVGIALSIRYVMRQNEKKQKVVEAELAWLKNQINPHFLFNTLNNISSLAQIDSDETQEAIMQLSDLLRYAMYETNKPKVALEGEVEFMRNYIELMKLRCNEMTTVGEHFSIDDSKAEIAPLLFISLIENAFKHGISPNGHGFICVKMSHDNNTITCEISNSNWPKRANDKSGSGIGLQQVQKRLDLMYPGQYSWHKGTTSDNTEYYSNITIYRHDSQLRNS